MYFFQVVFVIFRCYISFFLTGLQGNCMETLLIREPGLEGGSTKKCGKI